MRVLLILPAKSPLSFVKYTKYLAKYLLKLGVNVELQTIEHFKANLKLILSKDNFIKIVHLSSLGRGNFPPISLLLLLKRARVPVVVTLHGFDSYAIRTLCKIRRLHCPSEYSQGRQVLLDSVSRFKWFVLGRLLVDAIITPSFSEKKNLVKALRVPPSRIHVIWHGVDHEIFKPQKNASDFLEQQYNIKYDFVLHISSYQMRKNVERIIAAYALLKRRFNVREVRLVIIGKHPVSRLMALAIRLGLSKEDVHFIHYVPEEHLPYFYSAARVFVFPSLHEGFGMPILEAMACGCPVITSNIFACPEVAGDAAILVDPFNVKDLAIAMWRVLSDNAFREELIRKGLERAKHFTWERSALMHLRVYKLVAESC